MLMVRRAICSKNFSASITHSARSLSSIPTVTSEAVRAAEESLSAAAVAAGPAAAAAAAAIQGGSSPEKLSGSASPAAGAAAAASSEKISAASPGPAGAAGAAGDGAPEMIGTASEASKSSVSWRAFKALIGLTTTAAVGGISYVSYAYSTEDIEQAVQPWRQAVPATASEDFIERMRYTLNETTRQAAVKTTDTYLNLRKSIEEQVKGFAAPSSDKLLPDLIPQEQHVYTIVLDLNETLVFSEWKRERGWGTFKRPGVEAFLEKLAHYYEIVVYSDQLSFYVDPILERLDQKGCIRYRLARDATNYVDGKHYRDLSKLNRDPKKVMYISGHALDSCLQPENAVPIKPWKMEGEDTALLDLLPFLEFVARQRPPDVRTVLASYQGRDIATEFRERAKQNQRRVQERKQQQGQGRFWRGV